MKAEELMIGDWVMTPYGPHKIDILYGDYEKVQADLIELDYSEIQPIPITAEFLEKNFEKKTFEKETFYGLYDDFYDVDIREYSEGVYMVTYHYCEFSQPDQNILVFFVHELQHALKLFGVELNIVI